MINFTTGEQTVLKNLFNKEQYSKVIEVEFKILTVPKVKIS